MKKLFFLLILFLALASAVFAQGSGPITVTEADGSPVCNNCRKFIFGNGSLTVSGNTVTISGGGGSGTVTSVGGSFTGGLISVAGSPVTTSGTLALTVAGTSGGVPYFSSGSTWASSAVLAANTLMIGGGAGNSPATASGLVYASSGSPTFSVTGQSASQLTTLITGANTSSAALLGIQLGTGGSGGDFIQFRNSSGTPLSVVDANGAAGFGITSSLGARLHSVAGGSGNAGRFDGAALSANTVLVTRQGGSSTGNLFEAQTSGGTAFFTIANGGQLTASLPVTTGTGATAGFQVTANSLTTGNGHEISSSSVSSGNVVSIAATGTAAASNTKTALSVATSGANAIGTQTTYGAQISNISTGTSSTNVALNLSASGGTSNYGAVITNGLVAFGGTAAGNVALNYSGTTLQVRTGDNGNNGNLQVGAVTVNASNNLNMSGDNGQLRWGTSTDLLLRRAAAAHLAFGTTDAASPVAQTLSVQSVVAGTSNTAGANWTFNASRGTGTGAGGSIIFQTAPAGGSGTSQNSLSAAFTVNGDGSVSLKSVTFANLPTVANAKMIYCSDCTIASPCASGGSGAVAKGINGAWVCN